MKLISDLSPLLKCQMGIVVRHTIPEMGIYYDSDRRGRVYKNYCTCGVSVLSIITVSWSITALPNTCSVQSFCSYAFSARTFLSPTTTTCYKIYIT